MGSNSADFLTVKPKDHKIETLLYEPLVDKENHLDFMHDYRKNDARAQGKCGDLKIPDIPTEQTKAAGITYIVNAEKTIVPLEDGPAIAERIHGAVGKLGLSLLTAPVFSNGSIFGVMKEGFVVARLWPNKNYVAFDINLWGTFDKLDSLKSALVEAVGSTEVSSYRVIVGGMFGASTWAEDQGTIGPQIVQTRNCEDPPIPTDMTTTADEIIEHALSESLNLALTSKLKSVVFCGVEGKGECLAAEVLGDHDEVQSLDKIFACSGMDEKDVSEETMRKCEYETLAKLKGRLGKNSKTKFNLLVVDSTVPYSMVQVLHSILGTIRDRKALIKKDNLFVSLTTNPKGEMWREQFLDRYRKQYLFDPVTRAQVMLRSGKHNIGFGLVSCGDEEIAYNLEAYSFKLQKQFDQLEKDVKVELTAFVGGEFPFMHDFEPNNFHQDDYDSEPGDAQFSQQEFLGRQNIFQLVPAENHDDLNMSKSKLKDTLEWGLEKLKWKASSHLEFSDVGDGAVHILAGEAGSVVGVWDGRNHIDINLFSYEELKGGPEDFIDAIVSFMGTAVPALRDDQPRGVGRVVNFPDDYTPADDEEDDTETKSEL